jgi:hypothetical protein
VVFGITARGVSRRCATSKSPLLTENGQANIVLLKTQIQPNMIQLLPVDHLVGGSMKNVASYVSQGDVQNTDPSAFERKLRLTM